MGTFDTLEAYTLRRCLVLVDPPSGLRAVVALDDLTLGPAAGGVRTCRYDSIEAAVGDAAELARAMTIKCALAGLPAGGGKAVVLERSGWDRPAAFRALGARVEELGGLFRTAGDLGTTSEDLAAMAETTQYVHAEEADLSAAVARGLVGCAEACARVHGPGSLRGLRILVQGCGTIGQACARALVAAGAEVTVSDLSAPLAQRVADELGATAVPVAGCLLSDVDVVAPCAVGHVIDPDVAQGISAWAVCGAANNVLQSDRAGAILQERGVLFVPDTIASAGAVIDGLGRSLMGLPDRGELIDRLGPLAERVLVEARDSGRVTSEVAVALAQQRLSSAR